MKRVFDIHKDDFYAKTLEENLNTQHKVRDFFRASKDQRIVDQTLSD